MKYVHNRFPTTGNADGVTPGNRIDGAAVLTRRVAPGTLAAEVTVTVDTPSLTFALVWQGANDSEFTEPIDLANEVNDAPTPLATGTTVLPAPRAVYGYRYARAQLVVAGATGTASDTYSISFSFGDPATAGRKRRR